MTKTALISVYDKTGIEEFAQELINLGWKIYASSGTTKYLASHGVSAQDTAELVGGGAILGHRVVTLSREIYAGLLASDLQESDADELRKLGIPRIDLVCVDLYPLKEEIAKQSATEHSVIEQTDIGGPTLLRAAAKGRRITISRSSQRREVIDWLKEGQPDADTFLRRLAASAEAVVADYVLDSARYHSDGLYDGEVHTQIATAKYGENPWQHRAWLYQNTEDDHLALANFSLEQGTPPSYNNYADLDRLLQTMTHIAAGFDVNKNQTPLIALGAKHGNVCGAAIGDDPVDVTQRMLEGDLRAIFGGVMMLNFPIEEAVARTLITHKMDTGRRLIDGIAAPKASPAALKMLQRKGDKCRTLTNPALSTLDKASLDSAPRTRYVRGGQLVQDNYTHVLDLTADALAAEKKLSDAKLQDVIMGWAIGSTSNSNTITLVKDGALVGNGVGQQDRVSAAELAIKRAKDAGHDLADATAYSDSFFPFPDGPSVLADAGISTIFASSGSMGDANVREACAQKNVNLITLPDKTVRGFYAH